MTNHISDSREGDSCAAASHVSSRAQQDRSGTDTDTRADKDSAPGSASNARGRQGTYKYTAFSYVQWCSRFHQLCTIAKCTEQDGSNFRDACTSSSSESSQLDTTNESQWSNVRPRLYRFTHQDGGFDSRLDPSAAFGTSANQHEP